MLQSKGLFENRQVFLYGRNTFGTTVLIFLLLSKKRYGTLYHEIT